MAQKIKMYLKQFPRPNIKGGEISGYEIIKRLSEKTDEGYAQKLKMLREKASLKHGWDKS